MTTESPPTPEQSGVAPSIKRTRRRRRPSGAPPPLPRSIGSTGKAWLIASVVLVVWLLVVVAAPWAGRGTDRVDAFLLRGIARVRTEWLTEVFRTVNRIALGWTFTLVAVVLVALLIVFRRWRHLFTFCGAVLAVELVGQFMYNLSTRPRPYDVTIIGRWRGFSMPAATPAILSLIVVGVIYSLVVPGRPRAIAKYLGLVVVGVLVAAELYLATQHPSDILVSLVLAVGFPLAAFRYFTPSDVFPVTYHGGKTAHLDVTGRRGEAIRRAVEQQLGVTVLEAKPVGLEGSGGSTPLRLCVAGEPNTYLFGKLYAMNHVRADRWYKFGRTVLYGRLEDEAPFQSVHRLVEYEDYLLRLMRDAGIPSAAPFGIVELTPEREYLLVTEFFDGAQEIGDAEVDDGVIDEGLLLVRNLWDAGLAHRDIKPANLLVKDGHILLIDVAFAELHPSPWRQAIDLANMMLVLALRTDPERVYRRALAYFTPDEIAEAFAATRGVASPTQLRSVMKTDGRNLVDEFRALAPARRPISLQRWGVRRVVYALVAVLAVLLGVFAIFMLFTPAELDVQEAPSCGTSDVVVLMAQSVPSATAVPCIATLPAGWKLGGVEVRQDKARFWLHSDRGGDRAVEVRLVAPDQCAIAGATEVPSNQVGMRRFERPEQLPPGLQSTRYYVFDGGCVIYRFAFDAEASASLMFSAESALAFEPRQALVEKVHRESGLRLCGAGAPPCPGGS